MVDKYTILDNAEQYSAAELADLIKEGTITFGDLKSAVNARLRKDVEKLLYGREEDDWKNVLSSKSIEEVEKFIQKYPHSKHIDEAKRLKDKIQENLEEYEWEIAVKSNSVNTLMNYILKYPESAHCDEARTLIDNLNNGIKINEEKQEWDNVDKKDIDALNKYIDEHPHSPYVKEAERLIDIINDNIDTLISEINDVHTDRIVVDRHIAVFEKIKKQLDNQSSTIRVEDILKEVKKDNNLLHSHVIYYLRRENYITNQQLRDIGINQKFVSQLGKSVTNTSFPPSSKIDKINKLSTEVYFWGIPQSGKSCALGAILSVASNGKVAKTMKKDTDCQGYGYMTRLSALFSNGGEVGILPEGTSTSSTYEMAFDLVDKNDREHPITCIDLAGEIIRCMYKYDANEFLNDGETEALDTVTNILCGNRTKNRKIHFFVLEYGAENRIYEGLSQKVYLDAALRYIERTHIFDKDTDAIYLMITKVDKVGVGGKELEIRLKNYVNSQYLNFYNGLKKICQDNEINAGEVEILPFSLGQVCFQTYCLFNEGPASNVVRTILERTKGESNRPGCKFFKRLKK